MKIAMLFPGYGSQFVGMGKELYDEHRVVQELFEEASNCLNINFVKLCFASSDVELARGANAYAGIFLTSCAIFALLKQEGINPSIVAGYDLGEYAALFAAGGISFPDGLYLLNKYATFYQDTLREVDVAVVQVTGLLSDALTDMCSVARKAGGSLGIVGYKQPAVHLVSGTSDAIDRLTALIEQIPKTTVQSMPIEVGMHSSLVDDVAQNFKIYLGKVDFKDLNVPFVSGVDVQEITQGQLVKEHVVNAITAPIMWTGVIEKVASYDLVIEIGPGTVLSQHMNAIDAGKQVVSINTAEDIEKLKQQCAL